MIVSQDTVYDKAVEQGRERPPWRAAKVVFAQQTSRKDYHDDQSQYGTSVVGKNASVKLDPQWRLEVIDGFVGIMLDLKTVDHLIERGEPAGVIGRFDPVTERDTPRPERIE